MRARAYATLLVHAEPGPTGSGRVAAAAALAQDLDAHLIGLGAETFETISDPGGVYGSGEWLVLLQEQTNNNLQAAETAFRNAAAGIDFEWRSAQDFPNRAMARTARAADLLIASPRARASTTSSVDPAELAMTAGRPVLLVPERASRLEAKTVVVAWKDTREARRALADALPFLLRADDVLVQAVCEPDENDSALFETGDVVAALKRHGVAARASVVHAHGRDVAGALARAADRAKADLIVAGAYGHSRAREWLAGGVTRELMQHPPCFVLFSH
jgi:nucleotide-binding universal stress UspA family protein